MEYQNFVEGLYVMRQFRPDKGVFHYAIMDVGNRLRVPGVPVNAEPVMIHKPPTGLRADYVSQTGGWLRVGTVADEAKARVRLLQALQNPEYDLFGSNCEHFVNFMAYGVESSAQVVVGSILLVSAIAFVASRVNKAA